MQKIKTERLNAFYEPQLTMFYKSLVDKSTSSFHNKAGLEQANYLAWSGAAVQQAGLLFRINRHGNLFVTAFVKLNQEWIKPRYLENPNLIHYPGLVKQPSDPCLHFEIFFHELHLCLE